MRYWRSSWEIYIWIGRQQEERMMPGLTWASETPVTHSSAKKKGHTSQYCHSLWAYEGQFHSNQPSSHSWWVVTGSVRSQAHLSSACIYCAADSDSVLNCLHGCILQPPRKAMFPLLGWQPVPSANYFGVIKTEICRSVPSILWCRFCSLWAWWCAWTSFIFLFRFFSLDLMIPKTSCPISLWPSLCLF